MAEEPVDRLRSAVDLCLRRGEVGPTSEARIKAAVADLIRHDDAGATTAAAELQRVVAARGGDTADPLLRTLTTLIMQGWSHAAAAPDLPARTTRHQPTSRRSMSRSLSEVPAGLTLVYDGVEAVVRDGRMYLSEGQHFDTPTPAARYVTGQAAVNGWAVWRLQDGRRLCEAYDARSWPG